MSPEPKTRMPIEKLRLEKCYIDLTPKQKKLVEAYIATGGDRVQSVLSAYDVKDVENARVHAYAFFGNARVIACLTVYFQDDPLNVFKEQVWRAYRNKKLTVAQVRSLELLCELNGWGSRSLPDITHPAQDAKTEDLPFTEKEVVRDGKRLRVRVTEIGDVEDGERS